MLLLPATACRKCRFLRFFTRYHQDSADISEQSFSRRMATRLPTTPAKVPPMQTIQLDDRSLNINTFSAGYVLMEYGLPEEAQCFAVHGARTAQARVNPQVPERREAAHRAGGIAVGFAFR